MSMWELIELSGGRVDGEQCLAPRGIPVLKLFFFVPSRPAITREGSDTNITDTLVRTLTYHRTQVVRLHPGGAVRVYRLAGGWWRHD